MVPWGDLQLVLAIARSGSLSRAAGELELSQPTLGRRLKVLERKLDVRLFDRSPKGLVVTQAGAAAIARIDRMDAEAMALERGLAAHGNQDIGPIRVTAADWFAHQVMSPFIARYGASRPGVCVELLVGGGPGDLSRREVDICYALSPFNKLDLIQQRVCGVKYGLYAEPGYLKVFGEPDFRTGCAGSLVIGMQDQGTPQLATEWLAELASNATVTSRATSEECKIRLAAAGGGLAVVPRYLGDANPKLRRIATPDPSPAASLWMGYHSDMREVSRLRTFISAFNTYLAPQQRHLHPDDRLAESSDSASLRSPFMQSIA